jgi:nitrite reductase/ring-hydroxylating ferredoxin subunit
MKRFKISSISENGSKGFELKSRGSLIKVLAVRRGMQIFCYRNLCPHTGVNLDWVKDQFLDTSGKYIQCATHGAIFQIEDGYCISGPCTGDNLIPLKVRIEGEFFEILHC